MKKKFGVDIRFIVLAKDVFEAQKIVDDFIPEANNKVEYTLIRKTEEIKVKRR